MSTSWSSVSHLFTDYALQAKEIKETLTEMLQKVEHFNHNSKVHISSCIYFLVMLKGAVICACSTNFARNFHKIALTRPRARSNIHTTTWALLLLPLLLRFETPLCLNCTEACDDDDAVTAHCCYTLLHVATRCYTWLHVGTGFTDWLALLYKTHT